MLSESLKNSKLDKLEVNYFVRTLGMQSVHDRVCSETGSRTHLVCGPRGAGKSTAMHKALENEKSVAVVKLNRCNLENFYSSTMQFARLKHHDVDKKAIITEALTKIQRRGGKSSHLLWRSTISVKLNILHPLLFN